MTNYKLLQGSYVTKMVLTVFCIGGLSIFQGSCAALFEHSGVFKTSVRDSHSWVLAATNPEGILTGLSITSVWFRASIIAIAAITLALWWGFFRKKKTRLRSRCRPSAYSAVAEKSDSAMVVLNENGLIEWINGGFTKVTGYLPKETIGKLPGSLLMGSNPNPQVTQAIREGLAGRRNFSVEIHSRHAQGHFNWLLLNFTPVYKNGKELTNYVVVANDITARKRAEEALSRASRNNELILNAMNEGVCGMDINGLVTFINCAATRMTGWKVSDMVGKPIGGLLHQLKTDGMPDIEEDHFLRVAFKDGKVLVGDSDLFLKKDGNQFPVRYSTTPIYEGNQLVGSVMVFRDISEQKQGEVFRARQGRQYALRAEIGFALATGDSQKSFLRACSQSFLKGLDAACCRIWIFDPAGNNLELEANAGLVSGTTDAIRSIPLGTMKVGMIARDRIANLTNDLLNDPDEIDKEWIKKEGLSSFVGLPIMLEGQLLAVIAVYSRFNFPPDTIDLLNSVSDSIGQGVLRKRAELRVVEQANLLDKSSEAILLFDLSGRLLFWNEKAQQIYGWKSEDIIGQAFDKFLFKDRSEFLRVKKEVVTRGEWKKRGKHQTCSNGSIDVLTRWVMIPDVEGNPNSIGMMIVNEDQELMPSTFTHEAPSSSIHPIADLCDDLREMFQLMAKQLENVKGVIPQPELIDIFESSLKRGASILDNIEDSFNGDEVAVGDKLARGKGECILVVDDEPSQLELTKEFLIKWGYMVITATDGIEAVTAYSKDRDKVALVLTDLTMPHMDGVATVRTFKQLNPDLPIIVVSDPEDREELKESVRIEQIDIYEKPLNAATLLPSLRLALSEQPVDEQQGSTSAAA